MRGSVRDLCFPGTCRVCGRVLIGQEKMMCLPCLYDLPRTYHWIFPFHFLTEILSCMPSCTWATSFLFFREESPYRKLLHRFKYGGEKEIGLYMGFLYGKELLRSHKTPPNPVIIPVPMSSLKRRKRGYNQAEWLAAGIALATGWGLDVSAVKRIREKTSQTVYGREERRENIKNSFIAKRIPYREVLVVDDIITTGATMESCARAILEINPGILIGFASLAYVE
ncbi:MAG: ComF family protein [Bacteroidales bacterium]|nr:ComF family protein [Bacteroidales bacterium]